MMNDSIVRKYIEVLSRALSKQNKDFLVASLVEIMLARLDIEDPNDQQHMINVIKAQTGVSMPNHSTLLYLLSSEPRPSYSEIGKLLDSIALHCTQDGWDGDDAVAVNPVTVANTRALLSCIERNIVVKEDLPIVVAAPTGGIAFIWETEEGGLAVEVGDEQIDYSVQDSAGALGDTLELEEGGDNSEVFAILGNLIEKVTTKVVLQ